MHRYSGRIYVCMVLLGAVGGLFFAGYAPRSLATQIGFRTLAGVTLRIQLGIFQGYFGLSFDDSYAIVAWFSWVPNIIIAEWLFIQAPLNLRKIRL